MIPAHWCVKRLKHIFKVVNGSTPASAEPRYWDGERPWVTPEDLGELTGTTVVASRRSITEAGYRS
jgi:type I restriction enzyme S subunit